MQPELLRGGKFVLTLRTEPILAFPVEGGTNRSIQSYFGAVRDGGRRDHHGIDIFAKRGTPVIAATDGVVRSISPNNLGGNVVWLSDGARGQSLYYAHLDRHAVTQGQRVRAGDTVGFVGNSGTRAPRRPTCTSGSIAGGGGRSIRCRMCGCPWLPFQRSASTPAGSAARDRADCRCGGAPRAWPGQRGAAARVPRHVVAGDGREQRVVPVQFEDGTAGYLTEGALRITRDGDARDSTLTSRSRSAFQLMRCTGRQQTS